MFDPTSFENMKVVMEGGLYDRDLSGEIKILDRNDLLNSAKLSRRYEVMLTDCIDGDINCTFIMEAGLENLAAELLPSVHSEKLAGCHIYIKFAFKHPNNPSFFLNSSMILKDIWGSERVIKQTGKFNPMDDQDLIENESTIIFNRLVYEDQIDDLNVMIDFMIETLKRLRSSCLD